MAYPPTRTGMLAGFMPDAYASPHAAPTLPAQAQQQTPAVSPQMPPQAQQGVPVAPQMPTLPSQAQAPLHSAQFGAPTATPNLGQSPGYNGQINPGHDPSLMSGGGGGAQPSLPSLNPFTMPTQSAGGLQQAQSHAPVGGGGKGGGHAKMPMPFSG